MRNRTFFILLLFLAYGCEKPGINHYKIASGFNGTVELFFYNQGDKTPSRTITKVGIGDITEGSGSPIEAFYSDSIVVIFNSSKKEIHFKKEPLGRSITDPSSYIYIGGENYDYNITDEDYENATPCDGSCN